MAEHQDRPTGWGDPPARAPRLDEVRAAAERLRATIVRTPLVRLDGAGDTWLKPETLQPTGSFKIRGVMNWAAGLDDGERARGFSTFSAGNTALALGYAARKYGVACRSMLPDYAPKNKVKALEDAGVETVLVSFDEMAGWLFRAGWRGEPWAFLHPWTEPAMIAGHATIGLELFEDCPNVDTVFVPVGGGALCAGTGSVLKALRPGVRVVAAQSAGYPALEASLAAGRPTWVEPQPTICDGVAVPFTTDQMFPLLQSVVDEVVVVGEEQVREAVRLLALGNKLVAEGAGALAVAAALATRGKDRGRAVCLVTGGSIGAGSLGEILADWF